MKKLFNLALLPLLLTLLVLCFILFGCFPKPNIPNIPMPDCPQCPPTKVTVEILLAGLPIIFSFLVITFVAGCAFAFFTKSSKGWVIPVSSIAGMCLIAILVKWLKAFAWIAGGIVGVVMLITLGLLVWKTWQYWQERNTALEKLKSITP